MARAHSPIEDVIRSRVEEHPDAVWLKFRDETYTWREVLSNIQRAANGLLDLGVRPGERVAIMMGNRPEFVWVHLGIVFIGALSVPVNTSQRGATLEHILTNSDSVVVVFEEELKDAVLAVKDQLPSLRATVVADGQAGNGVEWTIDRLFDQPDTEPDVEVEEPVGGAGIMYTSGTTGPPKGVVATKYDTDPLRILLESSGVKPGETMYTALPLFHGNALLVSMLGSMLLDAKFALGERFSASRFFDECRRYEAVEFNTLGSMISILLKQPPRSDDKEHPVRVVVDAGCPPQFWEEFERRFGVQIIEWFGMVDAPGILLNDVGKVGAMGKPVAGLDFRVVDEEDNPLPPGEVGELVFRHPHGQLTYYHKLPEATEKAYKGGWFHSGDLAVMDEEGFFYYKGRKKESIRRRGENISAWEIESVVNHHPAVLESAAYDVPSELGEDEVKVEVILKAKASLSPEELLDHCQGKMAHYAVPRYVEFVESLPKTETQRNQYGKLRERGITEDTWDREAAGYRVARA
jgi:crotonobetaine/carnitine-CoA ligase